MTKRQSDTSIFVGRSCEVCGKRVHVSKGSGYWSVTPAGVVKAWHMKCALGDPKPK